MTTPAHTAHIVTGAELTALLEIVAELSACACGGQPALLADDEGITATVTHRLDCRDVGRAVPPRLRLVKED